PVATTTLRVVLVVGLRTVYVPAVRAAPSDENTTFAVLPLMVMVFGSGIVPSARVPVPTNVVPPPHVLVTPVLYCAWLPLTETQTFVLRAIASCRAPEMIVASSCAADFKAADCMYRMKNGVPSA